jgi:hypothetical protein
MSAEQEAAIADIVKGSDVDEALDALKDSVIAEKADDAA